MAELLLLEKCFMLILVLLAKPTVLQMMILSTKTVSAVLYLSTVPNGGCLVRRRSFTVNAHCVLDINQVNNWVLVKGFKGKGGIHLH